MIGYSFQFVGACLGDVINSGDVLLADLTAELKPLDIVSVILKHPLDGPYTEFVNALGTDGHAGVVKVFIGQRQAPDGEKVYLLGQLNPPCLSPIPASAIEAMHKVPGASLAHLSPIDAQAVSLLLPFCRDTPASPINTEYVSHWPEAHFDEMTQ